MSDTEFKVGDRVRFTDQTGLDIEGDVLWVGNGSVQIELSYGAIWWVNPSEIHHVTRVTTTEEYAGYKFHVCVPYVGPIHVEDKCVHCNRRLEQHEINAYLQKVT